MTSVQNNSNNGPCSAGKYKCGLTLDDGSYHWADFTLTVEDGDSTDILVAVQTPVSAMHGSSATLAVRTASYMTFIQKF